MKVELTSRELFVIWQAVCYWNEQPFTATLKSKLYKAIPKKDMREFREGIGKKIDKIMY